MAKDTLSNTERQELEALRAAKKVADKVTMKVGAKGGVSVYGMGRFPTTLYPEQWIRLLANAEAILEFIEANKGSLTWK